MLFAFHGVRVCALEAVCGKRIVTSGPRVIIGSILYFITCWLGREWNSAILEGSPMRRYVTACVSVCVWRLIKAKLMPIYLYNIQYIHNIYVYIIYIFILVYGQYGLSSALANKAGKNMFSGYFEINVKVEKMDGLLFENNWPIRLSLSTQIVYTMEISDGRWCSDEDAWAAAIVHHTVSNIKCIYIELLIVDFSMVCYNLLLLLLL